MSNLYFSHGDKGGVGKSMVAALLVDALLTKHGEVGVVEGDTQGDIAARFIDYDEVKIGLSNLNRAGAAEEAILAFSNALEPLAGLDVVVNLPAGAGDTLEEFSEPLVAVAEQLGWETFVFYSLGHQPAATKHALRSLEYGLLSAVPPDRRVMVFPEFLGKPEAFDWVKQGMRGKFDGKEIVIPAIRPDALAVKILGLPGSFSAMSGKDFAGLTLMEKALLQSKWTKPALAAVSVFDVED